MADIFFNDKSNLNSFSVQNSFENRWFFWGGCICIFALLLGFWFGFSLLPSNVFAEIISVDAAKIFLDEVVPGTKKKDEMDISVLFRGDLLLQHSSSVLAAAGKELEGSPIGGINVSAVSLFKKDKKEFSEKADLSAPIVALYCTHSSETYIPTDGQAKLVGKNGGVHQIAEIIRDQLISRGVSAVLSDTIHDYPDWSISYANSLETIKSMKEQYPSLMYFIDVHRDALPEGVTSVFNYKDEQAASVMLIVGSDQRAEHPNWRQNHAFAQKVGSAIESKAEGILRGVRVQSGRYNQHYSPNAILLEMGSSMNSLSEVKISAVIVANALADIILAEID